MTVARFLPPSRRDDKLVACLGLVSDTHYPLRCTAIPATVFDVLTGVDLLLHAGDVGELAVLDQLSTLAPVVAVHGNDEAEAAQSVLPYQQVITVAERRILLWHSHFPDRQEELAARVDDAMTPKFQRTIERAQAAGATIAVFGHWHIPLIYERDGVTVINPGALASGNFFTRQLVQSVAVLYLFADGGHHVAHIDLATAAPLTPHQAWPASFQATLAHYSASILAPPLEATLRRRRPHLAAAEQQALIRAILPLAQRCWRGEEQVITMAALTDRLATEQTLTAEMRSALLALLHER